MNNTYIKAVRPNISTAKLMKTGQTTSYRTGDDGDLQEGRDVDFFTLAQDNPFGNTDRFTDELGTQVYANNIFIDWSTYDGSTVLGYTKISSSPYAYTWNQAIDTAKIYSISTFTIGWRLVNMKEILNIMNFNLSQPLNYIPINIGGNLNTFWTSTTVIGSTSKAMFVYNNSNMISTFSKINYGWIMACRNFTVTGTTLS